MSFLDSFTRPRTLGVLLVISFGINLFLLGLMAGRIGTHFAPHPHWMRDGGHGPACIDGPPGMEIRAFGGFDHHVKDSSPETKKQRTAMRELHREIRAELMKDEPDRAAIEKLFTEQRTLATEVQQSFQAAFLDRMLKLDAEQRRDRLERMKHARCAKRMMHHGHGAGGVMFHSGDMMHGRHCGAMHAAGGAMPCMGMGAEHGGCMHAMKPGHGPGPGRMPCPAFGKMPPDQSPDAEQPAPAPAPGQ